MTFVAILTAACGPAELSIVGAHGFKPVALSRGHRPRRATVSTTIPTTAASPTTTVPPATAPPTTTVPPVTAPPTTTVPTTSGPTLPDGAIVFDSDREGGRRIFIDVRDGSAPYAIASDAAYDSFFPRVSPDRRTILFQRAPAGAGDRDYSKVSIWTVGIEGTGLRLLIGRGAFGWETMGHPEWSPDGTQIALFGGPLDDPEVHVVDADGANPRRVTDRPGVGIDPSWSPDGTRIAFVGCAQGLCNPSDYEVFTVPVGGGEATRVTDDGLRDQDPYYSKAGDEIVFITQSSGNDPLGSWNLRIGASDGSSVRSVTNEGNAINGPAHWSADSRWLLFHRLVLPITRGFEIYRIHPDGTCLEVVETGHGGINEYPTY